MDISQHIQVHLATQEISIETGRLAPQADTSLVLRHKKSMILSTLTIPYKPMKKGQNTLSVEYRERLSAADLIPGNYFRREARPSEHEILIGRMIARAIRPAFPSHYEGDPHLHIIIYSADPTSDIEALALLAAGLTLYISPLPVDTLVAGCRVFHHPSKGCTFDKPSFSGHQLPTDQGLFVAMSEHGVTMLDGPLANHSTQQIIESCTFAQEALTPLLTQLQRDLTSPSSQAPLPATKTSLFDALQAHMDNWGQYDKRSFYKESHTLYNALKEDDPILDEEHFQDELKHFVRRQTLDHGRLDGRAADQLRALDAETTMLPMAQGSAFCARGLTQALVTAVVADAKLSQEHQSLQGRYSQALIVHYNFPGFAVNNANPFQATGFREHGHGHLARKALLHALPKRFLAQYTLRIASDITSSDGSSSMATVCGASLAMMDAGLPLDQHIAGVSVGMIQDDEQTLFLTDICELEDFYGDMDLKVTGHKGGFTALQLDLKCHGLPIPLLQQALERARAGLDTLLTKMDECLPTPRVREVQPEQAEHQLQFQVKRSQIGRVIGPGGSNIKALEALLPIRLRIERNGQAELRTKQKPLIRVVRSQLKALTLDLHKDKPYLGLVFSVEQENISFRIGSHIGTIQGCEDTNLQVGAEIMVIPTGVDPQGQLTFRMPSKEEYPHTDALNYIP